MHHSFERGQLRPQAPVALGALRRALGLREYKSDALDMVRRWRDGGRDSEGTTKDAAPKPAA